MKHLDIQQAASTLTTLLDEVIATQTEIVMIRNGIPVARIVPCDLKPNSTQKYPLRGMPIAIAFIFWPTHARTLVRFGRMILLDTHVWWLLHDPTQLSSKAQAIVDLEEPQNGLLVSAISVWEIAVKSSIGKLKLPLPIDEWYKLAQAHSGIVIEPLSPLSRWAGKFITM